MGCSGNEKNHAMVFHIGIEQERKDFWEKWKINNVNKGRQSSWLAAMEQESTVAVKSSRIEKVWELIVLY